MTTPKRPRDTNQLAKMVVDIATGESEEAKSVVNEAAQKAGVEGGKARAAALTERERSSIAAKAARIRWNKS